MRNGCTGAGIGRLLLGAILALQVSACGSTASPSSSPTVALASRPSSPVTITLISPTVGEVVHGSTVHVVIALKGGTAVDATAPVTDVTKGHVHLYLQNRLVYMSYTLTQDVPVSPGLNTIYAEWVGTDHIPFNPRVKTLPVIFTVAAN